MDYIYFFLMGFIDLCVGVVVGVRGGFKIIFFIGVGLFFGSVDCVLLYLFMYVIFVVWIYFFFY